MMILKPFSSLLCLLLLIFSMGQPVAAQSISVIAVVNGEPITSLDLQERLDFLAFTTGQTITEKNKPEFSRDALQLLIDEKLKIQAANMIDPSIVSNAKMNARTLVERTYGDAEMSASAKLRANNVSIQVALKKAASDLAWVNVLQNTFPRQFESLDNLANDELERLKNSLSEPQVRLLEIVLLPSQDRPVNATLDLANQIVEAVRNGTDFRGIARQYSIASSAQNGGDIGWAQLQRLPAAFIDPLDAADVGMVLEPIVADGIVYILMKEGYRADGYYDISQFRVSMSRAVMPIGADSTATQIEARREALLEALRPVNNCADMRALNTELGSGAQSDLNDLLIGDLAPQLGEIISSLDIGERTEPLMFAEGLSVIMLCQKSEPDVTLPSIEEIKRIELDKLFSVLSGRYLIRLRRSAVIEKRS